MDLSHSTEEETRDETSWKLQVEMDAASQAAHEFRRHGTVWEYQHRLSTFLGPLYIYIYIS